MSKHFLKKMNKNDKEVWLMCVQNTCIDPVDKNTCTEKKNN